MVSHSSFYMNLTPMHVNLVNDMEIFERSFRNWQYCLVNSRKLQILVKMDGFGHFATTSTFYGFNWIPSWETTYSKKWTFVIQNLHFENFAYFLCCFKVYKVIHKCYMCSSLVSKNTRMSSMKVIMNLSKKGLKARFIKSIKAIKAFVNLKYISKNL